MAWTPEKTKILIRLHGAYFGDLAIALATDMTADQVREKAKRLSLQSDADFLAADLQRRLLARNAGGPPLTVDDLRAELLNPTFRDWLEGKTPKRSTPEKAGQKRAFEDCLEMILDWEGGFVDHPQDPGGATNKGITLETYQRWCAHQGHDVPDVVRLKSIPMHHVKLIYREEYWDAVSGDRLPEGLNLLVFDAAVLSGPTMAIKTLQRVLAVEDDGRIGPVTLGALARHHKHIGVLIEDYQTKREAFFRSLSTFKYFGNGWLNRLESLANEARLWISEIAA